MPHGAKPGRAVVRAANTRRSGAAWSRWCAFHAQLRARRDAHSSCGRGLGTQGAGWRAFFVQLCVGQELAVQWGRGRGRARLGVARALGDRDLGRARHRVTPDVVADELVRRREGVQRVHGADAVLVPARGGEGEWAE